MTTQNFKRDLLLNLYREGKNYPLFVSSCRLRERKCLTLAGYFLCLETPGLPACYPLNLQSSQTWTQMHILSTGSNRKTLWKGFEINPFYMKLGTMAYL